MQQWMLVALIVTAGSPAGDAVAADVGSPPPQRLEQPRDPWLPTPPQQPGRQPAGRSRVLPYPSVQVNVDADGANRVGDAANEPSIAIDPTNPQIVVIGWRQFDSVASDFRQAGYGYSHDGGLTWTFPGVLDPGVFRSDPVLGSSLDGDFYYYSLRVIGNQFLCGMFISSDGGVTWQGPIDAFGGDKAWITVDHTDGVGSGHIYAAWSTAGNNFFPNQFIRSSDGGLNWGGLAPIPPDRPIWGTLTVDPAGDLYVSGQSDGIIRVAKSTNAKLAAVTPTFPSTVAVPLGGVFTNFGGPNPGGLLGQVGVAADHSGGPTDGNIYVVSSMDPAGPDPLDVYFARSEDGGATWSPPLRVNDDEVFNQNHWQWFATLSVAPNGRIDVIWNDTRRNSVVNLSELYYAYSYDAGATWSVNLAVSPVFDSFVGWPQQQKLGDYYHMISDHAAANLAYAATFNNEQDVYFVRLGDCNHNGVHDGLDLSGGTSFDQDGDGVPDECLCPPDLTGDGVVDAADLALLLGGWGPAAGGPADLDGDGAVGAADLALLLGAWGPC